MTKLVKPIPDGKLIIQWTEVTREDRIIPLAQLVEGYGYMGAVLFLNFEDYQEAIPLHTISKVTIVKNSDTFVEAMERYHRKLHEEMEVESFRAQLEGFEPHRHQWVQHIITPVDVLESPLDGELQPYIPPERAEASLENAVYGCHACSAPLTADSYASPCPGADAG